MTFTYTFGELLAWGSAIVVINGAVTVIAHWIKTLMKPSRKIAELEKDIKSDSEAISELVEDNRVTQKALIAILESAINGNNISQLREAQNELTERLISR